MSGKPPDGFCRMHTREMDYCGRPGAMHLRLGCQHEHLVEADLCGRCLRYVEHGRMQCGDCATAAPELIQPWMSVMPRLRYHEDFPRTHRPVAHEGCVFIVIPEPPEPAEPQHRALDSLHTSA